MTSLDATLLEDQALASLVRIARQRRLVLENGQRPRWVDLCWVDEVVLALIGLAREHDRSITIVYPAPAGQVAVLLAAQLLLHQFVHGNRQSSVGIVTADTTMAARTWNGLRITTTGAREPIAEVFPCFRAGPEGESPGGGRRLQGVIIGQQCKGWPVDHLVVDHLAGLVRVDTRQPRSRCSRIRSTLASAASRRPEGSSGDGRRRVSPARTASRFVRASPSPSRWPRTGSRRWPVGSRSACASRSTPRRKRQPHARARTCASCDRWRQIAATATSNADCPQPGITSRPSYPCPALPRASTASPECRRSRRERHGPSRRSCPPGRTP